MAQHADWAHPRPLDLMQIIVHNLRRPIGCKEVGNRVANSNSPTVLGGLLDEACCPEDCRWRQHLAAGIAERDSSRFILRR